GGDWLHRSLRESSCGSLDDFLERIRRRGVVPADRIVAAEPRHLAARVGAYIAGHQTARGLQIDLATQVRRPVRVAVGAHAREARIDAARNERTRLVEDSRLDHLAN